MKGIRMSEVAQEGALLHHDQGHQMLQQDAGSATDKVDELREGAGAAQPEGASFAGTQCSLFTVGYGAGPECVIGVSSQSQGSMLK